MGHVKTGAGLSTLSRGGWNIFLHRQLARTLSERFARPAHRIAASRGAKGEGKTTILYRRLGDLARPLALRVDFATRRRRFHQPLAADQVSVFESFAHNRTAFAGTHRARGTCLMATPVWEHVIRNDKIMRRTSIIATSIRSNMATSNGLRIGPIRRSIVRLSVAFILWIGPVCLNPSWKRVNVCEG